MAVHRTKDRLRDRWIRKVLQWHRLILILATVLTALSAVVASRLQVDSDLRALLPKDHRVVQGLQELEQTFGSTGSVNVVIKGGTQQDRHAFTDALAERLRDHPLLESVDYRLPSDFFTDHALYYLSQAEMEELDEKIQAWTHYEFCSEAPDTCVTKPDPEAPEALEAFVEAKREEALHRTGFRDRYEREGIDANVVLLHPTEPPSSLEFAEQVTAQMRSEVADVFAQPDASWSGSDMRYNIVGPYVTKADEQETIRRDIVRAGGVALGGVVLILYILFRSTRAVLVLIVPLSFGVVWSLAATQLVLGHLNMMTSLISTVVMGAGIDAGIHFMVRARRDRREHDDGEAIRRAFYGLIVPLLIASSTTVGAFAIMATSEFPAFREFGIIAAMGVALCLLSMVTVLPALAYLVGIKRRRREPSRHEGLATRAVLAHPGVLFATLIGLTVLTFQGARGIEFEYDGRALQSDHARENTEPDTKLISRIFGKDIHAGIVVRPTLEDVRRTLELARKRHEAKKLAGETTVAELFAAPDLLPDPKIDKKQRREQIRTLLEPETIDKLEAIAGGEDIVDDDLDGWEDVELEDQPADETADDLDEDWDDVPVEPAGSESRPPEESAATEAEQVHAQAEPGASIEPGEQPQPADGEPTLTQQDAQQLLEMIAAEPFTIEELPEVLRDKIRTKDGEYPIYAYPDFDAADMRKGVEFTRETSAYLPSSEDGIFIGETTVYAAMFLMLRQEAPVVLGMAAVLIAGLVYWQLRSIQGALLTLLPLGLALWWLVGLMGAIGLKFTLFNLPILPAILGIGVDNGVYLTDRIRRTRGEVDGLARTLQETGGAIMAAMSTTAIGFAAFMVADSAGVRGIGAVAVLGILLAGLAAVLVLPTLSELGRRQRKRRGTA